MVGMSPTQLTVIAALAAIAFVVTRLGITRLRGRESGGWAVPAALSACFATWTAYAISEGGLLGFWAEHTQNAWQVQIWFDLLLAIGVAWYLLQSRLRLRGIAPLPWFVLVVATGSIGLLALLARLIYAESAASRTTGRAEVPA